MSAVHEVALLTTLAFLAWIILDVGLDRTRRQRLRCVLVLASSAFAWASGEFLLGLAVGPGEILGARRVLFAGVCTLPASWVWTAWVASRPDRSKHAQWLFLALWAPSLAVYTCLYFAPGGIFLDWTAMPVRRGPIFFANVVYSWILIGAGAFLVLRAMREVTSRAPSRIALVAAAALVPLLTNAVHVFLGATAWDPTPVALG